MNPLQLFGVYTIAFILSLWLLSRAFAWVILQMTTPRMKKN